MKPSVGISRLHTVSLTKAGSKPALPPMGYALKNLVSHFGLVGDRQQHFAERFGCHALAAQEAHDSPEGFAGFVDYSTQDAVFTHLLFEKLQGDLSKREWHS